MKRRNFGALAVTIVLFTMLLAGGRAFAQKQGGVLREYLVDSPASMSIHEEATVVAERPVMGVFNNLVLFDQHVPQNTTSAIKPELATRWSWNEDGTELTFPLHQGVKWHDGAGVGPSGGLCSARCRRRRLGREPANANNRQCDMPARHWAGLGGACRGDRDRSAGRGSGARR